MSVELVEGKYMENKRTIVTLEMKLKLMKDKSQRIASCKVTNSAISNICMEGYREKIKRHMPSCVLTKSSLWGRIAWFENQCVISWTRLWFL